jgi:hypothetical protein
VPGHQHHRGGGDPLTWRRRQRSNRTIAGSPLRPHPGHPNV